MDAVEAAFGGDIVTPDPATTAKALVAPGKGILAADESDGTIARRFESIGVESTEAHRRAYRELLFTTGGIEAWTSGVILFDETIRQAAANGTPFPRLLAERGIIVGIKVDAGTKPLALSPGETITEGLDGLRERLSEYRELGARFAKWRAVLAIEDHRPSEYAIWTNAHALARYAALSQEAGLVPIVEPEVLMDGDHTIETSFEVTSRVLPSSRNSATSAYASRVVLKPNMVLAGYACRQQPSDERIAEMTVRCLRRHVPAAVPGILFLSGGQSDENATSRLNAVNTRGPQPWALSFSYGRALQASVLTAWRGEDANISAAQHAFALRARLNGAACSGSYEPEMEAAGPA